MKLRSLFGNTKEIDNRKAELFINRKKIVLYNCVLINSASKGDTLGEIICDGKYDKVNSRVGTVITEENCHLDTLKKNFYLHNFKRI